MCVALAGILSTEYKQYVGPRSQGSVNWVEPASPALEDNIRNEIFGQLVQVYRTKKLPPSTVVLPSKDKAAVRAEPEKENGQQEPVQPAEVLRVEDSNVNGIDLEKLDGAEMEGGAVSGAPPMPKPKGMHGGVASAVGAADAETKKAQISKKKAAAALTAAAKASGGKPKKRKVVVDSSDEEEQEDSSSEEDVAEGEGGKARSDGEVNPPPPKPPPKKRKQTPLIVKTQLLELAVDHPFVTAPAVDPELTPDRAAGRFVFVPASQFKSEGIGGWIAK